MRSIWKGSINFGMVAIPAKLYTATDDKKVSLHQIHAECGSRLQMPKWCPSCGRQVALHEVKKGYEIASEQHIILEEADFQSLPLKSLKQIAAATPRPAQSVAGNSGFANTSLP